MEYAEKVARINRATQDPKARASLMELIEPVEVVVVEEPPVVKKKVVKKKAKKKVAKKVRK